ncbi:MAG: elongation factor Ts [Gammaproteobacteria bacterium]|nr:MAG: elongation factor Ts [Gammaproteobacteria bacterium]
MTISASQVKELRERTGAGMMECKKALVEVGGDLDAAQDYLRKHGQAKAARKAGRVAAEGRIELAEGDSAAVLVEVNCETDFVAKDENFLEFTRQVAATALGSEVDSIEALMAQSPGEETLAELRNALVAKIGENITVRRFEVVRPQGELGAYLHGSRIGVLVDVSGGDEALRRDLAMHIAASNPRCVSADDLPAEEVERERQILSEQAAQEGKPPEIVARMVEGRLRKYLNEITLLGQPFVKDPDKSVGQLLKERGAQVHGFVRLEVGEGIEKKAENFAAEVQAQLNAQG